MPAKKKASERVDKRYKTKMVIPGSEKPVWITAKTKKELEEKKRQVRQSYIDGVQLSDRPFAEVLVEWFKTDKEPDIKNPSTLANWRNAINLHILPYIDHRKLCRAIRYKDLKDVMAHLKGMNNTTITLVHSALTHACHYAVRDGLMVRDPSVDLPTVEAGESEGKDAFTDEQTDRLLATAAVHPFGLFIYLLYYTGMRRGEALGLQWGDVDFKTCMIHVQRDVDYNANHSSKVVIGDLKTSKADRYVPMPSELQRILDPLRGMPSMHIINVDGAPLSYNQYSYRIATFMIAAGFAHIKGSYHDKVKKWQSEGKRVRLPNPRVDYAFDITPHWFRHNYITACVLADIPAEVTMRIVGHADYKTTINIYTHIREMQKRKAAVQLSGVLKDFGKVDKTLTL